MNLLLPGLILLAVPNMATASSKVARLEEVEAKWLLSLDEDGTYEYIDFRATRYSSPDGTKTRASLTRGTCWETNHGRGLSCRGDRRSWKVKLSEFVFSPAFDSASVRFDLRGQESHVTWAPLAAPPQPYRTDESCPAGSSSSHGLHRYSEAQGRIFGLRLHAQSSTWNQSWLQQGVALGDC